MPVDEMRVVLTVQDYDAAVAFYRDALGLTELEAFEFEDGRVRILAAGRATLEIADAAQAAKIDQVEVGRRVAGDVRIAFQVPDSAALADQLVASGGAIVGGPVITPWRHRNVRIDPPEGVQLTLFSVLD